MDGAAGLVAAQLGEVQGFGYHALTGERGVPVYEDRENGVTLIAEILPILLSPDDAFEHAVSRLKVRRVGRQIHGGLIAARGGVGALRAQVVLDVSRALHGSRIHDAVELREDLLIGLACNVG